MVYKLMYNIIKVVIILSFGTLLPDIKMGRCECEMLRCREVHMIRPMNTSAVNYAPDPTKGPIVNFHCK